MPSSFRMSAKAVEDLKLIGLFMLQRWGRDQRNTYLHKLDESFHLLSEQPFSGAVCDDIRRGYRVYHVGRHLIFYRLVASRVEIIRILHERMNVEGQMGDSKGR
ncbi:type II toxin-antitoxin system RelE/ParE family toxin [Desulfoluna sp.]|uniref:type II toxin-antitoxin system RelE/ParE family toxin n=1 Tax=Desulfoluna sp. TaxID=2045199 RepID=UPI0026299BB1|nr:type II toxin-antitoxin system RelE/ParE family toxin [Desulfoluna sp.]